MSYLGRFVSMLDFEVCFQIVHLVFQTPKRFVQLLHLGAFRWFVICKKRLNSEFNLIMWLDFAFFDVIMIKQNKYHQYHLPTLHYKSFWNHYEFMIVINIDGICVFIGLNLFNETWIRFTCRHPLDVCRIEMLLAVQHSKVARRELVVVGWQGWSRLE
jgi:hypothetical protein